MPKDSTLEIQNMVRLIGEKLGFTAVMEERLHSNNIYAPIYDVVWYLELDKFFNLESLRPLFSHRLDLFKHLQKLPIAGFEIEGSTTSSKNQISNFANLYSGNFFYNFVIVNNDAATSENDTYRRGVKINNYFKLMAGFRNVFFLDKKHLDIAIDKCKFGTNELSFADCKIGDRKGFGGENRSINVFNELLENLSNTGLLVKQNWSPELSKILYKINSKCSSDDYTDFVLHKKYYNQPLDEFPITSKNATASYYIPKLDVVLGFNLPESFKDFLFRLSIALGEQYVDYPILFGLREKMITDLFVPLVSIEIETSINKHLNGGIFNMSKNSYCGILVTEDDAHSHLQFFMKELGINNITSYCMER